MSDTITTIEDAAAVTGQTEPCDDLLAFLRRWRTEYPDPDEQLEADIQDSRRSVRPPHDPWD